MSLEIKESVPLAEFTTFKIGGKARFFIETESESDIIEALKFADSHALEVFVLGGGSNVLIADEGFDGLVLKIALKGVSLCDEGNGKVFVTAGSGENWDRLVAFCVGENLQGFECLSGIPGLVGGTPVQNVGAYGQEVSETILSVRCFDRKTKQVVELSNAECRFEYRASIFNTNEKNRFIVLAVTYNLKRNGEPKIAYRDLQSFFGENKPTLQEVRDAVLEIRRAKSMVIDKNDANSKSAGSFFKNPVVSLDEFAELEKYAGNQNTENVPHFKFNEQSVKVPAAWLIEKSGFGKGFRRERVGISSRHTLAIVNLGAAEARDILSFKDEIQAGVKNKFKIDLKPEPIFVGFKD